MRLLCISDEFPWPATTGYRLRLDHVVRGMASVAPMDLVVVADDHDASVAPAGAPVEAVHRLHLPPARRDVAGYLRWIRDRGPRTISARPWSELRRTLPELVARLDPTIVWWSHADLFIGMRGLVDRPAVVDLDNLEDRKLRDRRAIRRRDLREAGRRATPAVLVKDLLDRSDEASWRHVQRRVLSTAAVTVVCSDLDRDRLDAPQAVVVPNGYDGPDVVPTRRPDAATFTMIGLFTYEPNLDAARFLVARILPMVLAGRPDACVRLVGAHDGALDELAGARVTVTGAVPDVGPELERATAVVVPVRFGGGTRLKVLEAFARGVPVVSTGLGAEGLGVHDGGELLLADDASSFAAACLAVLADPSAASARAAAAHRCWHERFSGPRMEAAVAAVIRAASAGAAPDARR